MNSGFEGNEFAIQVIATGSYLDNGAGDRHSYLIEATIIRLNHIALNAWHLSETFNVRDCYNTDEEWEAHKAEYAAKRDAWKAQITDALGIDTDAGSISITQSISEVFTVVHIRDVA